MKRSFKAGYSLFFGVMFILMLSIQARAESFLSFVYHDVLPDREGDHFAVTTQGFIEQMEYFRAHDYHPVTIDALIAAREGRAPLPENPVLITIDDGRQSFYENIFPILKLYNYPAVLSIVASWAEHGFQPSPRAGRKYEKITPMTWRQIKEVADSGLIEIASHSFDLHKGRIYNPYNNEFPAGSAFAFDAKTGGYESREAFRMRIRADLQKSVRLMKKRLGKAPRVMVWPFGEFNGIGMAEARKLGMAINFSAEDGFSDTKALEIVYRGILMGEMDLSAFVSGLQHGFVPQDPTRAVQIDLDLIYDPDPAQQERNLGRLLDRLISIDANVVYLQAFADPDGDGNVSEVYFPNRLLPMRADLFNRASHQIKTRTPVEMVYGWMPLLAFELPDTKETDDLLVRKNHHGRISPVTQGYRRLSPFSAKTFEKVSLLYEDLAIHSDIEGILFQDDATLNDFEDFHPDALKAYEARFGHPFSRKMVLSDAKKMKDWADFKTKTLINFSQKIAGVVKRFRPNVKIARNIYARVLTDPASKTWFAQDYPQFLKTYDYVVVMAYPEMEREHAPLPWLSKLVEAAASHPAGLDKTVFKLQTYDWVAGNWKQAQVIRNQMDQLRIQGARHLGYYPDNVYENRPDHQEIKKIMSLSTSPFTGSMLSR
ncbi:MAG: poly-beta-1,6-N-acetyl-D-glucosamine N-deacetylase PgaB [Nitrospiria bacterium]